MSRSDYGWAIKKSGPPPHIGRIGKDDYPDAERASTVYTHFITGYAEEEIAKFMQAVGVECSVEDIERDIQHIQSLLPTRVLIAHQNDRNRLLIQRTEGKQYRRLLAEALAVQATNYIASGVSPTGPLKEYREAVGMQEKPGGINVHLSQQNLNVGAGAASGVTSSEDLLRRVMSRMKSQALPPQGTEAIEVEASAPLPEEVQVEQVDVFEDDEDTTIPDPDE